MLLIIHYYGYWKKVTVTIEEENARWNTETETSKKVRAKITPMDNTKDKKYSNPCSRCGTERVLLRTWTEKTDNSVIVNREMICPNPECQKEVVKENKKQTDKYTSWRLKGEERAVERRKRAIKTRQSKKK